MASLLIAVSGVRLAAAETERPADRSAADTVVVAGATGRLGAWLLPELKAAGFTVRGMTRDPEQARQRVGSGYEWVQADVRDPASLPPALAGAAWVVSAVGAIRPDGRNAPQFVDYEGVRNLVDASVEAGIDHFVLVSSIGVTQRFHLLNLTFGDVLTWKWRAEEHLRASGLTYTIVRPGGLRPGPGGLEGVSLEQGDKKGGSYIFMPDAAAVIAASLGNPATVGKTFEILSGRELAPDAWRAELEQLYVDP